MERPQFIWCDAEGLGRNVFVLFRRSFRLTGEQKKQVRKAELHLFGDTRYRLWVNGEVVAYGPARFLPAEPEYDTVDLRPWLTEGPNALVVEVNSFGAKNFEAMPSVGGFIAWGQVQTPDALVDLRTPGQWKMWQTKAWDQDAPAYSFAQAPAEILDTRNLPAGLYGAAFDDSSWAEPVVLRRQDAWGKLKPRSIPMLTMDLHDPERLLVHSPLAAEEQVVGARVPGDVPDGKGQRVRCCYATNIYSPVAQQVTLGMFWGPHFLNGQPLSPVKTTRLGNREDYPVSLRAGWNFLYGEPELLRGQWGILIALPTNKGLVASAECDVNCPDVMVFSEGVPEGLLETARAGKIPAHMAELPALKVRWHRVKRGQPIPLPARLIGWDTPVSRCVERPHTVRDLQVPAGQDWVVLLDFGKQFLGHIVLDVEAAAGTILDVAYDERLREDDLVGIYRSNPFVDNADRFITAGGRQRIEGFRVRGGRYVQVAIRAAAGPVTLRSVRVRNTVCPVRAEGRFTCSDPMLNWIWATSLETLLITVEDCWSCDAWRERAMYVNDSLVICDAVATFWSDPRMFRRAMRLWAGCQSREGMIPAVVPAWWNGGGMNSTSFWVLHVCNYVDQTADLNFLREMWPHVTRALDSPRWRSGPHGLIDTEVQRIWFDWGVPPEAGLGENAVLNAHYYAALRRATTLAELVGDGPAAQRYRSKAQLLKAAFQALWDEEAGRYAPTLIDGKPLAQPAAHANVLALLYGLAEGPRAQAALAYVEQCLSDAEFLAPGHMELYFHYWALEALYQYGRVALAEHVMRRTWGLLKNAGAWSLWETWLLTSQDRQQKCQGWSAAPMIAMARRILGVRPVPRRPREVLIAPTSATLSFACGTVAHPLGPIDVSWRLHDGLERRWLELEVCAPRAVRLHIRPEGPLAEIPVRHKVRRR